MAGFPLRQWDCEECQRSPQTHAQRGRCGGDFGPSTPGAKRDARGRWWLPVDEACRGTGSTLAVADLRLYRCPMALARQVWAGPAPQLCAASQQGGPTTPYGVSELSEGGAAVVRELRAAWGWRHDIEREVEKQLRENLKGGARG